MGRSDLLPDSSIGRVEFEVPSSQGGNLETEVSPTPQWTDSISCVKLAPSGSQQPRTRISTDTSTVLPLEDASIRLNRARAPDTAKMLWKHHQITQLLQERLYKDAPSTWRDLRKQADPARSSSETFLELCEYSKTASQTSI